MSTDDFDHYGSVDSSVLYAQDVHRSVKPTDDPDYCQHVKKWNKWEISSPEINERLRQSGFYLVTQSAADILCHPLLTALIQR